MFYPYVSEMTREAVKGMRSEKVRLTRLAGETIVRQTAEKLRGPQAARGDILRSAHGKPYLCGVTPALYFNISHSGDYVVAAFSDAETGIDIEKKTACRMEVARRFFHPEETARLEAAGEEERRQLFFDYWTIKESFLKYTGSGLTAPLSGFRVSLSRKEISIRQGDSDLPVYVQGCAIDPDYACFLTSANREKARIQVFCPEKNETGKTY